MTTRKKKKTITIILMALSVELFMIVVTYEVNLTILAYVLIMLCKIMLPIATVLNVYYTIPNWFADLKRTMKLKIIKMIGMDMERRKRGIRLPGIGQTILALLTSLWNVILQFFVAIVFIPLLLALDFLLALRNGAKSVKKTSQT